MRYFSCIWSPLASVAKTPIYSKCYAPSSRVLKEIRTHFPDLKEPALVAREVEDEDQMKINFIYPR